MAKVAMLPCYVWANFPERRGECCQKREIHHKLGELRNHDLIVCLCFNHHSAQTPLAYGQSVHKGTETFEAETATQDEMVKWTDNCLESNIEHFE